jgi:hypothetical protein
MPKSLKIIPPKIAKIRRINKANREDSKAIRFLLDASIPVVRETKKIVAARGLIITTSEENARRVKVRRSPTIHNRVCTSQIRDLRVKQLP